MDVLANFDCQKVAFLFFEYKVFGVSTRDVAFVLT